MSSFTLTNSWKLGTSDVDCKRYYSNELGTTVIFVQSKSAIVYGTLAFPTRALNDNGAPHALEHLVFMGSDKYPFKGVLDQMAHRSLGVGGTNAWTATDHTAYTWECAGKEGNTRLFPVFLDHVLNPKITEHSVWSEVYHVNSKQEEQGVVYAEMEAREKTKGDRMFHGLHKYFFDKNSGYHYETGGTLAGSPLLSTPPSPPQRSSPRPLPSSPDPALTLTHPDPNPRSSPSRSPSSPPCPASARGARRHASSPHPPPAPLLEKGSWRRALREGLLEKGS